MTMTRPTKLTPMYEQYFNIKDNYEDCLLFYRMGDFYELFFDDAEVAARELQITLTSRSTPNSEMQVPMCGVPHHAARGYIQKLTERGFKVALCEQVEDPREAKGLVKRDVVRIYTAGTIVEDEGLEAKGHNYLAALYWNDSSSTGGVAWLDLSTGDWSGLYSKRKSELWQWAQKMEPRELLVPEGITVPEAFALSDSYVHHMPVRGYFDPKAGERKILDIQGVAELGALGLEKSPELVSCCGALLTYAQQTQKGDLSHLGQFSALNLGKHLVLDEITERNLEIFRRLDGRKGLGTLWHVLDHTLTPMGGRLLGERLRHPWRELGPITETQDAVGFFVERDSLRADLRMALKAVFDLERLTTRINLGRAMPKDYVALRDSLNALPEVRKVLESPECSLSQAAPRGASGVEESGGVLATTDSELKPDTTSGNDVTNQKATAQIHSGENLKSGSYPTADDQQGLNRPAFLLRLLKNWDDLADYRTLLDSAVVDNPPHVITEGGLFKQGFHAQLDELMELTEHGEGKLEEMLREEQQASGISKMKLKYNRVFGYFLDVPKSMTGDVPEYFVRRQTLANSERYSTPKLKELEEKLLAASDKRKSLEYKLFQQLRDTVAEARPRVLFMADMLACLDYWQGLAEAARKWNWVRPALHTGQDISIRDGRHPVVEAVQGSSNFIPNDLRIDEKRKILLITGPNMAGKSTVLRQAAILCIMAQIGSFVPASEASVGLADRIFSRVGASDNLAQGQSTFMVEMMETARILRQAGKRSLVILDEIGRGTSTFDGLSLAWSVVEELARRSGGIRTLFATHYHELTALEGRIAGVHNMNIAIKEWGGEIVFLRRLVPGPSDRSYGIEVAKLAGVPASVVKRAKTILNELERKSRDAGRSGQRMVDPPAASQSVLPGMPEPEPAQVEEEPPVQAVEHPLLVALADLDVNNMTPMDAFTRLTEWKMLWGNDNKENPDG